MPNPKGVNQYTKRSSAKKKPIPTSPNASNGGKSINRVDAAAVMYGKGSKQHKAAMKRWGTGK